MLAYVRRVANVGLALAHGREPAAENANRNTMELTTESQRKCGEIKNKSTVIDQTIGNDVNIS